MRDKVVETVEGEILDEEVLRLTSLLLRPDATVLRTSVLSTMTCKYTMTSPCCGWPELIGE